jgi:hypothetical protein
MTGVTTRRGTVRGSSEKEIDAENDERDAEEPSNVTSILAPSMATRGGDVSRGGPPFYMSSMKARRVRPGTPLPPPAPALALIRHRARS